ncbi:MAG: type II secretion system F family protein [Acidimicrobiia bacterium]
MRRLSFLVGVGLVGVGASPALAQESETAASGAGSALVILAAIAGAIAVFLLIIILFGSARSRTEASINKRLSTYGAMSDGSSGIFSRFRFLRRAARTAESAAARRGATSMIEAALETADLPIKAGEAIIGAIGIAAMTGIVITAVTRSVLWGIVAAAVVVLLALTFVNQVAARHRKRFEDQLPDTLNLISTSLRAGYSLLQAVEAVGEEAAEPTRREFGRAMAEIRLGKSIDDALGDIATRMMSQDFDWTVLAINIQREVGGNLAEVLQTTAETMVQRNRLRREMKALTAEGRISAIVLAIMPIGLFAFISLVNPGYLAPLLENTIGIVVMIVGGVFILIGIWWMQKIVKVDI